MGKSELTRVLEQAEMRLMDKGQWVGTLQEYDAEVIGGLILAPREVENIISVSFCNQPIDLKNIFFRYHKQGHHHAWGCATELRDEGEITDSGGFKRKQYRLYAGEDKAHTLRFVAKLRWLKKQPTDPMIIRNFEAIRQMCMAILFQKQEKYQEALASEQMVIQEVDKQLSEYLSGQPIAILADFGFGRSDRHRHHGLL